MVDTGDGERLAHYHELLENYWVLPVDSLHSPKKKVTLETKMMHKTFFKDTDKMCDFNRSFVSGRCYLLPFLAKV